MAGYSCNNPKELKDAVLRRLGAPVINIEITDDQIYDCIQRALELYGEYHYEGLNKNYMAVVLNEEQAKTGLIQLDDNNHIFAVTKILRADKGCLSSFGGTTYSWFSDFVNGLAGTGYGNVTQYGPFGSLGGISMYASLDSYMNTLQDVLNPLKEYWYNGMNGQLKIFGNLRAGEAIVVQVYVKSYVDLDYSNAAVGAKGLIAGHANENDGAVTSSDIYDNSYNAMPSKFVAGAHSNEYLNQNVYNVRWVKDYTTSLVKELNGSILAKHQGLQLPNGVTVDGIRLIQEAREEIENLRNELYGLEEPLPILMG